MQIQNLYRKYLQQPAVQTDTRKLQQGDIFFALKGPNFNANEFISQAFELGASFVVADEKPEDLVDDRIILVPDVLHALQQLAHHHRKQLAVNSSGQKTPFIAITGSNGKTTSKELVHAVLSTSFKTYTTEGNLNNHIGIPLTILKIKSDVEIAIVEMGANHQKEIETYCSYTEPTHGVITNCGKAHLEGFGSEEGIRKGKGELFDYLRAHKGSAFIMNDYDYLNEMSLGIETVKTYGTRDAEITGTVHDSKGLLEVEITAGADLGIIKTNLVGEYNLPNVLLAVSIGRYFNIPEDRIKSALESYLPDNSRSQLIEINSNKIILDAYNANPTSMKAAIENFANMEGDDKVLLLGGMKELGDDTMMEHRALIELIEKYIWKDVVLVGAEFADVPSKFLHFNDSDLAAGWYRKQGFENTLLLIKGSRSTKMENILQ